MKSKNNFIINIIIVVILFTSCDKMLLIEKEENTPINNFNTVWENFDRYYGGFIVKDIDWDALYTIYRPMVNENSTEEELYNALIGLFDELNDSHVFLKTLNPNLEHYNSGPLGKLKVVTDFKLSTVENNYLTGVTKLNEAVWYGMLDNNIGYIYIDNFSETKETYESNFNEIIEKMQNTGGLVVDIRAGKGGYDPEAMFVAGYFATEKKLAISMKLRNGAGHNDFTDPIKQYVKPQGNKQYTKDVVVLTNRFTISASESFILAMSRQEHVTFVGDTTSGAFSDAIRRDMPNGWIYRMSVAEVRTHDGTCWEGIGYPPDVVVQNDPTDVTNGIDEALEKAIELLK